VSAEIERAWMEALARNIDLQTLVWLHENDLEIVNEIGMDQTAFFVRKRVKKKPKEGVTEYVG